MDTARRHELRTSLVRELERASSEKRLGSKERVSWLLDQLTEHFGRWLGFCAISDAPLPLLVNSVLLGAVDVSTEAVGEELERANAPSELLGAWRTFRASVKAIRRATDKAQAQGLRERLLDLRARAASAEWE